MMDLSSIYPNYKQGQDINPGLLTEQMMVIQTQEEKLAADLAKHNEEVDGLRFEVTKQKAQIKEKEAKIELMVEREMVDFVNFPKEYLKNKETTTAYIRHIRLGDVYYAQLDELAKMRRKLVDTQGLLAESESRQDKYKLLISTYQNSINTAVNVLSWLKHEAQFHGRR